MVYFFFLFNCILRTALKNVALTLDFSLSGALLSCKVLLIVFFQQLLTLLFNSEYRLNTYFGYIDFNTREYYVCCQCMLSCLEECHIFTLS